MIRALVTVVVLSILAGGAMLVLSPHGVHATPDSFTYLGAAHSLARGEGWTYPFGVVGAPVTLFPPLYPVVLTLPELIGVETFAWVTWQNAVLLAVFSLVVGVTVANVTRGSVGASTLAVALTLLGTPTIVTYARIWSESLFLPLVVGIIACLDRFFATKRWIWLVGAGVLTSIAMLTRYGGLSIFVTSCLVLALWPGRGLLDRIRTLALYGGIALPLSGAWLIRNQMRSGTLTGNNELVHGLSFAEVVGGFGRIRAWFTHDPITDPTQWPFVILTVGAGVLAVLLAVRLVRKREIVEFDVAPIVPVCLAFVVVHVSFIAIADAFSTRAPPFNDRILGPAFVPLLLAIVVVGHRLWAASGRSLLRLALAAGALSLVISATIAATDSIPANYTTRDRTAEWYDDLRRALAESIDPGSELLSNRPSIAWFVVGEPVSGLPKSCRGGGVLPSPTYARELRQLSERLGDAPRQVLVFKRSKECEPFSVERLERTLHVSRRARVPHITVLDDSAEPR